MNYYRLNDNINYVIIDNKIVILDFNDGSFYLLDEEYCEIFETENNRCLMIEITQKNIKLLDSLIKNNFICKI